MIAVLLVAVEAYCNGLTAPGGLLFGVNSVHVGPVEPESIADQLFPALVINVTPAQFIFPRGDSQAEVSGALHLQLYTLSMDNYQNAVLAAWRLFLSDDKTTGLIRAVALQRGYTFNGGADGFVLTPGKAEMVYGARAKRGYTVGINLPCTLSGFLRST